MSAVRPLVDFTVRGSGEFPYDMLRYDDCWPIDSTAVGDMVGENSAGLGVRSVRMRTIKHAPTHGRWDSFNWKVQNVESWRLPKSAEDIAADERGVNEAEASAS